MPTFHANGAVRAVPWVFEKPSAFSSKLMSVLLVPMTQSSTFKKFGVGPSAGTEDKEKVSAQKKLKTMIQQKFEDSSLAPKKRKAEGETETETGGGKGEDGVEVEMAGPDRDEDDGQPAEADAADAQKSGKVNKKAIKSKFVGFSPEEKKVYSEVVSNPREPTEFRIKTALDEIIGALAFKADQIRAESKANWEKAGFNVKQIRQRQEEEESALMSTMGFCISIFLEFTFTQQVAVNGTQFRAYTGLRSELQGVLQVAHSTWSTSMATPSAASASGADDGKQKDALSLAQMLCEAFVNKPITAVSWNEEDDEDKAGKNVAATMTLRYAEIVQPLQVFLKEHLRKPILLHDFPRDFLKQLAKRPPMELIDVLSFMVEVMSHHLPFSWVSFATDVSDCFGARKRFVENTEKAGSTARLTFSQYSNGMVQW